MVEVNKSQENDDSTSQGKSTGASEALVQNLYAIDGVNVYEGDEYSKYAGNICKLTFRNSPYVDVHDLTEGNFRGPRAYTLKRLPEGCFETTVNDGIGTKVEIHDAAKSYEWAAYDVMAMTGGDITRYGGLPLIFTSVLDVAYVGEQGDHTNNALKQLMDGMKKVADEHNFVVFNGETAELGKLVGTNNKTPTAVFNRAGTMQGVYHPDKMILGDKIKEGDIVIALKEHGFRSNGISSVRKALAIKYGESWHTNPDAREDIIQAAAPSLIYDGLLTFLNGWMNDSFRKMVDVHGIVHVTGGAYNGKLLDLIKGKKLKVTLDNLYELPDIMKKCAEWRGLPDDQVYSSRNGGQGMLLVVDQKDVEKTLHYANTFDINAKIAGYISSGESGSEVEIHSKLNEGTIVNFKE